MVDARRKPAAVLLFFGVVAAIIAWKSSQSYLPTRHTPLDTNNHYTSCNTNKLSGTGGGQLQPSEINRIFVVGCGHSGTSLLLRTIGNLPGVRCFSIETGLFLHNRPEKEIVETLAVWDKETSEAEFPAWVEKTPKHVLHIGRLLEQAPDRTKVVMIHRDGRDVVASLVNRGLQWDEAIARYIDENEAALPYLDDARVFKVKFETFMDPESVLGVMRDLTTFLNIPVSDIYLAAGLLASSQPLELGAKAPHCQAYESDAEKYKDLGISLIGLLEELASQNPSRVLGGAPPSSAGNGQNATAAAEGRKRRETPLLVHQKRRTEQMSQAWQPQNSIWENELDNEKKKAFGSNPRIQKIMKKYGYS